MKRILAAILAFAFLFVGAAYSETGKVVQPDRKDQELTLPNVADYFGESVDSGYLSIATDFSGNYDMFRPATLNQIELYRVRMEVLGYAVSVAETKDDVQMWLFSSDGMPFLVLAFSNRQVVLCLKDGVVCSMEETPTSSPIPLSTPATDPSPAASPSDDPWANPYNYGSDSFDSFMSSDDFGPYDIYGEYDDYFPYQHQQSICKSCYGTGTCGFCNGSGISRMYGVTTLCGACDGTGVCGVCGGTGRY